MIRSSLAWPAWIWRYRSSRVARPLPSPPRAPASARRASTIVRASLLVRDDAQDVAGLRDVGQAEHDDRRRRAGLRDALAGRVLEGADLAERLADDDDVADAERAGLDDRRGDRAAALVELGLDDRADRRPASGWP